MPQVHLIISGVVQGVGFRQFIKRNAVKLGVNGWTRNLHDGKVEVVAMSSDTNKLQALIDFCHKGPFFSEVKKVTAEWEEGKEETAFTIR